LIETGKARGASPDLAQISNQAAEILAAREIRQTLEALRRAGSLVMYLNTDVSDPGSVARALDEVRNHWGPITGLVHAAGVLADKRIEDKTEEQFRRVFATKVAGMHALLTATATDPLDLIVCFSSVAARYGNTGQCDYAAANEVINQLAAVEARRRGTRCLIRSIGWGPWEGGMVTPALASQFTKRGVELIPLAAGARHFVREIGASNIGVEVLIAAGAGTDTVSSGKDATIGAQRSLDILVNYATYPLLNGHRIKDAPTVPVVMVLEWFHRFAGMCFPKSEVCQCLDLRVIRGVLLTDYDGAGQRLRLQLQLLGADLLQCDLRSASGDLHYSAQLTLRPRRDSEPAARSASTAECFELPQEARTLYAGALFHGPDFQVIHSIQQMDAAGATATLAGTTCKQWQSGPWQTEAAAIDGALQLVRLWGIENLGRPSLPTCVGSYVHHAAPPNDGLLSCTVRCRSVGTLRTISDVQLADSRGSAVAELHDVEMHILAE
jgi:NAD(P)-dependent dehydrogenase (short-subunit alcohol dehydrogenase family)